MELITLLMADDTVWLCLAAMAAALVKFGWLIAYFMREAAKPAAPAQARINASNSATEGGAILPFSASSNASASARLS